MLKQGFKTILKVKRHEANVNLHSSCHTSHHHPEWKASFLDLAYLLEKIVLSQLRYLYINTVLAVKTFLNSHL